MSSHEQECPRYQVEIHEEALTAAMRLVDAQHELVHRYAAVVQLPILPCTCGPEEEGTCGLPKSHRAHAATVTLSPADEAMLRG